VANNAMARFRVGPENPATGPHITGPHKLVSHARGFPSFVGRQIILRFSMVSAGVTALRRAVRNSCDVPARSPFGAIVIRRRIDAEIP